MGERLTYANVMSTIAVFLALGGGVALASAIKKNSVATEQVRNNSLKSADLKDHQAVAAKDVVPAEKVRVLGEVGGPTLGNGGEGDCQWTAGGSLGDDSAEFYKDTLGRVQFSGVLAVENGSGGDQQCMDSASEQFEDMRAFTLPTGYRPSGVQQFFTGSFNHQATVIVNGKTPSNIGGSTVPPGAVVIIPTIGTQIPEGVSIGSVSFRTD